MGMQFIASAALDCIWNLLNVFSKI